MVLSGVRAPPRERPGEFAGTNIATTDNTMTYHDALCLSSQNFKYLRIVFSFSWELNGMTDKEHYGMLRGIVCSDQLIV